MERKGRITIFVAGTYEPHCARMTAIPSAFIKDDFPLAFIP